MRKEAEIAEKYITILAMFLIVVVVILFLAGGFSGTGSPLKQSREYWAAATPFSITASNASGTELDLELINNAPDRLTITGISIGSTPVFSNRSIFNGGDDKIVRTKLGSACGAKGAPFAYSLSITYSNGSATGLNEVGAVPLVGSCS